MAWPPTPHVRLGAIIREARLARGATQKDLAAELGVSRATFCRWERGVDRPTMDRALPLARALRVDPMVLLEATDPEQGAS